MPRNLPGRALLLAACLWSASSALTAATFTVTNTNDSGSGSLRQAILDANANPGMDVIGFAIGSGARTISPLFGLPTITDLVIIDATTQPGYTNTPLIEISGALAGPADGLTISAGNSMVQGIAINRFQPNFLTGGGNGIVLGSKDGNTIRGNFIGVALDGTTAAGNGGDGILITSSSNNSITQLAGAAAPVISGNSNGVRILGNSSGNLISSCRIGTNVAGNVAVPNLNSGIVVLGGSNNSIVSNVVSGNGSDGVIITGAAFFTYVTSNRIGTNAAGTAALPNGSNGVEISGNGVSQSQIGGDTALQAGNVISGNTLNGVLIINGATNNHVEGNRIGTDAAGLAMLGNGANGVIVSGASGNFIGHPAGIGSGTGFANVICGNGTNGVRLRSGAASNAVQGNRIGIDASGAPAGNVVAGVQINDGATGNVIGGSGNLPFQINWISGNTGDGVLIADAATNGNAVLNNAIGLDVSNRPAPNGGSGVRITAGASGNTIGDPTAVGAANRIAFNVGAGALVESGTGNAIRGNSIWANGALGIDLAPAGVTANDHCDADLGANGLQNFPAITSVSSLSGTTTVQGSLDSTASSSFTLDFYANTECDPSGYGQGRLWIGSLPVTTDAGCAAPFQVPISTTAPVQFVTATATDAAGNTSEFSACIPVPAGFYPVTPCRLLDTRGPAGALGGPALAANADRIFPITGHCGIPLTAKAVALTVTVTQPTVAGDLRLYPGGGTLPGSSTINYGPGQTRASNSVIVLGPSSDFVVRCVQASGSTHFLADVSGYFE